jgi:GntR family transcriptional regulator/MocR family aminotransferase
VPPSRLLAQQLGISRKPVADAYARLTFDKLLVGHTGRGTFIKAPPVAEMQRAVNVKLSARGRLDKWESFDSPLRQRASMGRCQYEFSGGIPAPLHFPQDVWRSCVMHGLRQESAGRGQYGATEGVALRESIASHAGFARGVRCTASRIMITNGAQQAFDLLGRIVLEPGSYVAVEDPGYPAPRGNFF